MRLRPIAAPYAAAVACWLVGCNDLCGNDVLSEVVSTDGAVKAVVFRRSCGATTGISGQVSIIDAQDQLPNEGGNVFIMDTAAPEDIRATWRSGEQLEIRFPAQARTFKMEARHGDIQVSYASANSDG